MKRKSGFVAGENQNFLIIEAEVVHISDSGVVNATHSKNEQKSKFLESSKHLRDYITMNFHYSFLFLVRTQ